MNVVIYALHIVCQSSPTHRSCGGWSRKCSIHRNHSLVPATTTLQEIEVNQTDKKECQMVLMKLALESIGDARNMLLYSIYFRVSKLQLLRESWSFLENFFQTLPDKENNYLIYQEMNKLADMVDNDRFNLLLEYLSHVCIVLGIFSFRV